MQLIRRAPGDSYTLAKFFQIKSQLGKDIDSFYLWSLCLNPFAIRGKDRHFITRYLPTYPKELIDLFSSSEKPDRDWVADQIARMSCDITYTPPPNLYKDILKENISKPLVLFGLKDHLTPSQFNPWIESYPWLLNPFFEIVRHHRDKKFLLLTSLERLDEYVKEPNVVVIPWGGDISNHNDQYVKVEPVIEKNLESRFTFLSLNRNYRNHRLFLLTILLELGIIDNGLTSCMFTYKLFRNSKLLDWSFSREQETIRQQYFSGFEKIKNYNFPISDDYEIYQQEINDNVSNFKNVLSNYYQETFVEFISETSCSEKCFNITEKTANGILGCSFPIWISSKGTVEFLRSTGMDVFDDIVNHNYDDIDNPIDRIYHAVADNLELLTDVEKTKSLWKQNRKRFLQNVEYFRKDLWHFYNTRLQTSIDNLSL